MMTSPTRTTVPAPTRRQYLTNRFHRHLANPLMRSLSRYLWLVADHGLRSQYVRNIQASPRVRVCIGNRWHPGAAYLLPDDEPHARLRQLPWLNSLMVRLLGTELLTIRIDLVDHP